jgi:phage tail-like protein
MDVNGTRFHLLLGEDDWGNCLVDQTPLKTVWGLSPPDENSTGVHWNKNGDELTLQSQQFLFSSAPKDIPPSLNKRRGAGRDRYGNWYWVSESGHELLVNSSGSKTTTHFWSNDDVVAQGSSGHVGGFGPKQEDALPQQFQFSGMAVTEDHYLVVGVLQPAGLLIFDLHAGGWPRQVVWPIGIDFVPFDMAPRPGGGVWILDKRNVRYWALDRHLNVEAIGQARTILHQEQKDDFQPKDRGTTRQTEAQAFPTGITLSAASPLDATEPIAIEALPDGTVLILDNKFNTGHSEIFRYRFAEQLGDPVPAELMLKMEESPAYTHMGVRAHDCAFVPEHVDPMTGETQSDRLYLVAPDGNQSFAYELSLAPQGTLRMVHIPAFFPMRLFGGKGLVAADSGVYYDFADRWIPLVEQLRPRYIEKAVVEAPVFDGREPDCVWHRLMLDACIPPESTVEVRSRVANDKQSLALAPWQPEPRLRMRKDGSELPFLRGPRTAKSEGETAASQADGTWEFLFQQAKGRYLQLRLILTGNGQITPRLRAVRAYYPRFSYLEHYLPAVYREDAQSASFLDRFLANFEGLYTTIEDKIAAMQVLFDTQSAPSEAVGWLASWFDATLDPSWDDAKRRLFIRHAVDFYRYRGTIRGLKMALHLAFDSWADETIFSSETANHAHRDRFRIVEKYRTRRTPGIVFGDPTDTATASEQLFSGLPPVVLTRRWQPDHRGETLHQQYRDAVNLQDKNERFPIKEPGSDRSAQWQQFSRAVLGFVPSATASDIPDWHDFLASRYRTVSALNRAYARSGSSEWSKFSDVLLPTELPNDGSPLVDWFQFEGVVLPMRRTAHRFSVLLPTPLEDPDGSKHRQRFELATRLIQLEKPAHTIFDVKFYWALFLVGQARLGEDTLIDLGSRAPQLMPPLVLGRQFLSESYLAPGHPQNVASRQVIGRDRLATS